MAKTKANVATVDESIAKMQACLRRAVAKRPENEGDLAEIIEQIGLGPEPEQVTAPADTTQPEV